MAPPVRVRLPPTRLHAAHKSMIASMVPTNTTHLVTVSLGRAGSVDHFNKKWTPETKKIVRLIIDIIDETLYRRKYTSIPRADRFAFVARGETVDKHHRKTYLHIHILMDAGSGKALRRFNGLRPQMRSRLFHRFLGHRQFQLKVNSNFKRVGNTVHDRAKLADYFAKAGWVDVERIYRRDDY